MFEIVEHEDVLQPESIESCAECPKLKHRFEIGDERTSRLHAGLKEHITVFLDGTLDSICTAQFYISSSNTIISISSTSLVAELPLDPGKVTLRVEFFGTTASADCPCEASEIELEIFEPQSIDYNVALIETVEVINGVTSTNKHKPSVSEIWHIQDRVSAGALYRMVLSPVGVSFARLQVWETEVLPSSTTGTYFHGLNGNQVKHAGQRRRPWNIGAIGSIPKYFNKYGIPSGDQVFSAFECKDVHNPLLNGTLTWDIPTLRETPNGGSKEIGTYIQAFYHFGAKKSLTKVKSYVSKNGVLTRPVKLLAQTYMIGYDPSANNQIVQPCN